MKKEKVLDRFSDFLYSTVSVECRGPKKFHRYEYMTENLQGCLEKFPEIAKEVHTFPPPPQKNIIFCHPLTVLCLCFATPSLFAFAKTGSAIVNEGGVILYCTVGWSDF